MRGGSSVWKAGADRWRMERSGSTLLTKGETWENTGEEGREAGPDRRWTERGVSTAWRYWEKWKHAEEGWGEATTH